VGTLIESVVAAAVLAIATIAFLCAIGEFGRFTSHQAGAVRSAATALAEQTLRVAQDAWKYGSPGSGPAGTFQTSVPLNVPGGAPASAPVSVTTNVGSGGAGSAQIDVTVLYTPDPDHMQDSGSVSLSGEAQVKAPLPGSTVAPAALIPQPANAP
jgi:type II secretory pathway pseudopilin PulG